MEPLLQFFATNHSNFISMTNTEMDIDVEKQVPKIQTIINFLHDFNIKQTDRENFLIMLSNNKDKINFIIENINITQFTYIIDFINLLYTDSVISKELTDPNFSWTTFISLLSEICETNTCNS